MEFSNRKPGREKNRHRHSLKMLAMWKGYQHINVLIGILSIKGLNMTFLTK